MVRSAIVQKLGVIGETASRVSDELNDRHAEVLWPKVVAFRNKDSPVLWDQIARILDEFGNPDSTA